jgi:hypothetical protein
VVSGRGKEDEVEPPHLARVRADPSWRLVELAASHVAHVTAPEKLSATLHDMAAE